MTAAEIVEAMRRDERLARDVLAHVVVPAVGGLRAVNPGAKAPIALIHPAFDGKWEAYLEGAGATCASVLTDTYGSAFDAAAAWLVDAGFVVLR